MLSCDMLKTLTIHSCNSVACEVFVDTLIESCKGSDSDGHHVHLSHISCVDRSRGG